MQSEDTSLDAFSKIKERKIILLLCCLAAIHVFVFSAAFPFFNNVDEPLHFDLVVKYAQGHVPRALEPLSVESAQFVTFYGSMAYFGKPDYFQDGKFPPPAWTLPIETVRQSLRVNELAWQKQKNYESSQPPLYYVLGGAWWRLGKAVGIHDGSLLYGIRFLNIFFIVVLVWLGYIASRLVFPENLFARITVPALLAFMPQTVFYSINNDVLSPLCFGAVFICLVKLLRVEIPDVRLGVAMGLALTATYLTKATNLPLLLVATSMILLKIWSLAKAGKLRPALPAVAALILPVLLAVGCWALWMRLNFGDFTGGEVKVEHLGWTHKPFNEWWHHPIFTLHGMWFFGSNLMATFWQGEFWWYDKPMSLPVIDLIYAVVSIGLVAISTILISRSTVTNAAQRQSLWPALWSFFAAMAFLGFLSTIYDFHDCPRPSRELPYFTSGRMILGALIPFMLLFVFGLDYVLKKFGSAAKFSALGAITSFMLITEIAIDWPVFSNSFNWFHI